MRPLILRFVGCFAFLLAGPLGAENVRLTDLLAKIPAAQNDAELNKVLADIKAAAVKLQRDALAVQERTGESVLPVDFFLQRASKVYVDKLTIRDSQLLPQVAAVVADGMLRTADREASEPADFRVAWATQEERIVTRLVFLTPKAQKIWAAFLADWRTEVLRVDKQRFQDALRQAAYSILRVSLGLEKKYIEIARQKNAQQTRRSTAASTAMGGAYSTTGVFPVHERLMNGIYRRHYRRVHRVDRIRARR